MLDALFGAFAATVVLGVLFSALIARRSGVPRMDFVMAEIVWKTSSEHAPKCLDGLIVKVSFGSRSGPEKVCYVGVKCPQGDCEARFVNRDGDEEPSGCPDAALSKLSEDSDWILAWFLKFPDGLLKVYFHRMPVLGVRTENGTKSSEGNELRNFWATECQDASTVTVSLRSDKFVLARETRDLKWPEFLVRTSPDNNVRPSFEIEWPNRRPGPSSNLPRHP